VPARRLLHLVWVGASAELGLAVWWPCSHCASRGGRSEPGFTPGPHPNHTSLAQDGDPVALCGVRASQDLEGVMKRHLVIASTLLVVLAPLTNMLWLAWVGGAGMSQGRDPCSRRPL